jgi:hypothetical protein
LENRNTQERPLPIHHSENPLAYIFVPPLSRLSNCSQPDARLRLNFPICLFDVFCNSPPTTHQPPPPPPPDLRRCATSTGRLACLVCRQLPLTLCASALTRTREQKLPAPAPAPQLHLPSSEQSRPNQDPVHRLLRPPTVPSISIVISRPPLIATALDPHLRPVHLRCKQQPSLAASRVTHETADHDDSCRRSPSPDGASQHHHWGIVEQLPIDTPCRNSIRTVGLPRTLVRSLAHPGLPPVSSLAASRWLTWLQLQPQLQLGPVRPLRSLRSASAPRRPTSKRVESLGHSFLHFRPLTSCSPSSINIYRTNHRSHQITFENTARKAHRIDKDRPNRLAPNRLLSKLLQTGSQFESLVSHLGA